jgi:predicted AAA+ superfamily ATPase
MVNPRKAYPVDPGLVQVFERSGRANTGHALETAVLLELERRGARTGYCRTPGGFEVDFHAEFAGGETWLIQVCASLAGADTLAREARALEDGAAAYPGAVPLLLSGDALRPALLPDGITWQPAAAWLLGDSAA